MKYNVVIERTVQYKGKVEIEADSAQSTIDKVNDKIKSLQIDPEFMDWDRVASSRVATKAHEIVPDFIQSCAITPTVLPMDENTRSKEPTEKDIQARMELTGENYYGARERLREKAYGGKPPEGCSSWGDYWKSL
jgi:hypothetical protein